MCCARLFKMCFSGLGPRNQSDLIGSHSRDAERGVEMPTEVSVLLCHKDRKQRHRGFLEE